MRLQPAGYTTETIDCIITVVLYSAPSWWSTQERP